MTIIHFNDAIIFKIYFIFQVPGMYLLTVIATVLFIDISASNGDLFDYACDPRSSEITCLLGCLGCFEYYGGQMYNMAACCQECKVTQSRLLDDGPDKCSQRFIKGSWMRRFGK